MLGRCHLITDPRPGRDPLGIVPGVLEAGFDVVQVRVKDRPDAEVLRTVDAVLELCAPFGAQCIVDDRLDVALAAGAHGVHLGADDLPVAAARAVAGSDLVIGATAREPAAGAAALAAGASYLGVGPAFATTTKAGLPDPIGTAGIAAVCAAVDAPVIAIAGVTAEGAAALVAAGAYGVAVAGSVHCAPDPYGAARRIVAAVRAAVGAGTVP